MAFKFVVLAVFVAVANAGGPAAYDIGTLSADHNSIGYSQESTQKGYGGQNVFSTYSRAEDSAHSSVRVSNSHLSNDALLEHHAIGYAAAAAAPVYAAKAAYTTYAAPALVKSPYIAEPVLAKAAYAAPALSYAAHPAPVLAKAAYATPAYGYAAAATPVLAKAAYAAPAAYSYASPLVAKTYAAPLVAKTYTTAYAAPAAPVYAKSTYAFAPAATTYAAAAPLVAKATYAAPVAPVLAKTAIAAAPAISYAAHAAPIVAKTYAPYSYETGAPVVHAAFSGFGTSYAW